ncbi:glycosyl hydrolase-related protein [candidate division KSB1 bacterium]|nr:glycosyl hydrolase-related protein [candidate division KSB1 bacterium]
MPKFMHYSIPQLQQVLHQIYESIYREISRLTIHGWCSREPRPFDQRAQGAPTQFSVGDKWGNLFDCAWFHFTGTIPAEGAGKHIVALLDVNGEMCVFDAAGTPLRGLTSVTSGFDMNLGKPGKRVLELTPHAAGGEAIEIWADAGCNDLFGSLQGDGRIKEASLAICEAVSFALYYDFEVLLDYLKTLPESTVQYQRILQGLTEVAYRLRLKDPEAARDARKILAPLRGKRGGDPWLTISAVGHAHLDLAWLWPIRESIRKGARTFATAIDLFQYYPDYIFGASQPQNFEWMQTHYPALYQKIKAQVKAGRIEPQGAMWVEADTNITGGESLVRQLLFGKRFFKREFGIVMDYLWQPDVFGYSAALPQILKKAGIDYFMTQKISWNLINQFPHQSFHWQGIDGSSVLTHMLPEDTYNGPAAPRSVWKIEKNYRDKDVSEYCLMVYGIGDGGGGPGAEHLERLARLKNLGGLCPVVQEPAHAFFKKWSIAADKFQRWVGELYLERHQGTFTTQASSKWHNRKIEFALRELEWNAVMAQTVAGLPYPAERLSAIWREVLLYQFHDILPGSSIKRVYDESIPRYQALLTEIHAAIQASLDQLVHVIDTQNFVRPAVIFNSLNWERNEWLLLQDHWYPVAIPGMGYRVIDLNEIPTRNWPELSASAAQLESDLLRVSFQEDGAINSIFDKAAMREVLAPGQVANRFNVYQDTGDPWDFALDYANFPPRTMKLVQTRAAVTGPRAVITQIYRLGFSELEQNIILTMGSRRIDFETRLHWLETASMLRTNFPVAIHAESVACEIQFGHILRPTHQNTTWDLAKDEIPAHKWVDLSQGDYGVALLNDSKYGYKVKGNVLELNLLRSVLFTGPRLVNDADVAPGTPHAGYTDQGDHLFTYALYPHPGALAQSEVIPAAYALNNPLQIIYTQSHAGPLPPLNSWFRPDSPNIIIETVKKAEDSNAIILRLYESEHRGTYARLRFDLAHLSAGTGKTESEVQIFETNLLEEMETPVAWVEPGVVMLEFKPFEIKTLKLVL